jgi:hypothetical protein
MSRRIVLGALALGIIWLYSYLLVIAFGYAAALSTPYWWRDAFGRGRAAFWMWDLPLDLFVTAVVSIPFALLIARYYRRTWLLVALLAAGVLAVWNAGDLVNIWPQITGSFVGFLLLGVVRQLTVLPVLTWLANKLPSIHRLERP